MLARSTTDAALNRDAAFQRQVDAVRLGHGLGRSLGLGRLFDYLIDVTRAGVVVAESDVAHGVFGRGDVAPWDASVRVAVHRLRRKLEAFYNGPGRNEPDRLTVPVGAYRLVLVSQQPGVITRPPLRPPRVSTLIILGLLAACLVLGFRDWTARAEARVFLRVEQTPLWRGLGSARPVILVIGDDYVFGETDGSPMPQRMVRDFAINSAADLDEFLMSHPELEGRYIDMNTSYAQVGPTLALRQILPLIQHAAGEPRNLRIMVSSDLRPEMLKGNDVVYVGYLSGLRILQEQVFEAARFGVGENFDQLLDRRSGKTYASDASLAPPDLPNHDLGYLASLRRATGEKLVVIAGARDPGVLEMVKIATDDLSVGSLAGAGGRVEAAYEVEGMGRTNFTSRRLNELDVQPRREMVWR